MLDIGFILSQTAGPQIVKAGDRETGRKFEIQPTVRIEKREPG